MRWDELIDQATALLSAPDGASFGADLGVHVLRHEAPTQFEATVYHPIVCLILQGAKETTIGERRFDVVAGHCVVVSHDVPVLARIREASPEVPYLALVIELDLAVLRSLHDRVAGAPALSVAPCCMEVAPVDDATRDVIGRYLRLAGDPVAAPVLWPLLQQELHFRLLMSPSGAMLRSLLSDASHASQVALAIQLLRQSFRERLVVAELARRVGMSASAFHKHFKLVTMTTPLQYQKDLRLTEARHLLRAAGRNVSAAAFEVGYESVSQFSREYARKFGRPPSRELDRGLSLSAAGQGPAASPAAAAA